jgi:hypothetical protein
MKEKVFNRKDALNRKEAKETQRAQSFIKLIRSYLFLKNEDFIVK